MALFATLTTTLSWRFACSQISFGLICTGSLGSQPCGGMPGLCTDVSQFISQLKGAGGRQQEKTSSPGYKLMGWKDG